MVSTLPTPVAAALGLVPTVLDGVRRLPGKAVALPIRVVGGGLNAVGHAHRTYESLAERGERAVCRLRGSTEDLLDEVVERADSLEDRLEDLLASTPVADLYDSVEDALEDASEAVKKTVARGGSLAEELQHELTLVPDPAEVAEVPVAEQPKGEPTPKAPQGEVERVDTAATPEVVAVVEEVVESSTAPQVAAHDDLPLPDYDHMTLGSLRGRLRSLSVEDLVTVRAYEKAHADRLPVVTMLDNRIARLTTDPAATPSPGSPTENQPVKKAAARKPKVTPATAATPAGAPTGSQPGLPLN
jgi:hypothetical protein